MQQLACSIVLYKNDSSVRVLVENLLGSQLSVCVYLIDNSPTEDLRSLFTGLDVTYIFNGKNVGYGAGHNIALSKSIQNNTQYHLVINPDITLDVDILERIFDHMEHNKNIGALMPKVFYENGELQRLCKLLPTPMDLFGRRFFPDTAWSRSMNSKYELEEFGYDYSLNTPSLSGCFLFLRTSILGQSGIFDERYFMYLEDYDLVRRIHKYAETIFFPEVTIIHGFQKESFKSRRLFRIHILSAIKYFMKWGWIVDSERARFNRRVLSTIRQTAFKIDKTK